MFVLLRGDEEDVDDGAEVTGDTGLDGRGEEVEEDNEPEAFRFNDSGVSSLVLTVIDATILGEAGAGALALTSAASAAVRANADAVRLSNDCSNRVS